MKPVMQIDTHTMSAEERMSEIADILARAIIRIKRKKLRKINSIELDSSLVPSVYKT